ncbi:phosphate ABC transporter permease PstA [Halocatena marina]|uniref:Phosphate transport system permease protein PstA n=1 Tax=Halocatena marina TaxID=2934937 RepID=A0ABD5YS77_9EURY|nr:phosphate ABC transporter permease PstA [Halocatena marina]
MSTESATDETVGETTNFGQVSRTRDVLFRYLLLAATLSGLVSLGALLVNVMIDALRPFSADTAWYLVLIALLVSVALVLMYFRARNREAVAIGAGGLFVPIAGLFTAGTLFLLFDAIPFLVRFAWAAGIAVPVAIFFAHRIVVPDASLRSRTIVVLTVGFVSLFGVPSLLPGIPEYIQFHVETVPNRYATVLFTLALPIAVLVGRRFESLENRRIGLLTGGLVILASLSVVFQKVLDPDVALLLVLTVAVPMGYYVVTTSSYRPEARSGLVIPAVVISGALVGYLIVSEFGIHGPEAWLDMQFLTSLPTSVPETTGLYPALVGSLLLMIVVVVSAFPLGVGAAVYLEEYAPDNRYTRFIQINIANLAGVPSVVYGLLGLGLFIDLGGFSGQTISVGGTTIQLVGLPTGSVLAGGLAVSLLILPIVIISSQEAIRSVPDSLKQASYGMGATRWQTVKTVVLPRAIPGILTGTILSIGRAVGETAPLIMVLAPTYTSRLPTSLFDKAGAMPLQVYNWAFEIKPGFRHGVLAAGVVTMLVVLLVINSVAIIVRNKYQRDS